MANVKFIDKTFKPHISAEHIDNYVFKVANELNRDFQNSENPPLFIGVLNGVYMFMSDLMKKINFECEVDFIKFSSYQGTSSTGVVKKFIGVSSDIVGRDIILVDEIVETGTTIDNVVEMLYENGVKSVKIATLIYKHNAHKGAKYMVDYSGYVMENNDFIIGYGLDYNKLGRNLPDIYIICNE